MNRKILVSALIFWIVVSAISVFGYPVLMSDTMNRFAPMADAFAAGDWSHAFHPRYGVLFSAVTGFFVMLGFRGDQACQIVGIGFLAASTVPIWYITRFVFDEKVAWATAILAGLMPEYFVFAIDGLRDCARCFSLAMLAYTFVTGKRSWVMAIGIFVMATVRIDTQFLAGVAVLVWMIMCVRRRRYSLIVLPLVAYILGIVLCCAMVYGFTGYFVPNAQSLFLLGFRK